MNHKQKEGKSHPKNINCNMITYAAIGLFILPILILGGLYFLVKNDVSLDKPDSFVQNQTSKVIEKEYFNIVLNRIPLNVETYDPKNDEMNYTLGIDTSSDRLNFGTIPTKSPARKMLNMANERDGAVKLKLQAFGNISEYITFETNDIILEPHTKKDIIVNFAGAEPEGVFGGELDVIVIVPADNAQNKNIFKSILYEVMLRLA